MFEQHICFLFDGTVLRSSAGLMQQREVICLRASGNSSLGSKSVTFIERLHPHCEYNLILMADVEKRPCTGQISNEGLSDFNTKIHTVQPSYFL